MNNHTFTIQIEGHSVRARYMYYLVYDLSNLIELKNGTHGGLYKK